LGGVRGGGGDGYGGFTNINGRQKKKVAHSTIVVNPFK